MKWGFSCNSFHISFQSCPLNFLSVYTLKPASTEWLQCSEGEIDFTTTTRQQKNFFIIISSKSATQFCFPEYSGTEWRSVLKTCSLWYVKVVVNSHCRSKVEYKLSFSQGPTHRSACQGHILFLQKMREHFFTYIYILFWF